MSNNYQRYQSQKVLRDYFKDRDTYNFKYGLEFGLDSNLNSNATDNALFNLDEDPTIFGVDIVILNGSPLFNEMDSFFDFGDDNNIIDIINRRETYDEFFTHFGKYFNVDDRNRGIFKVDNRFNSFKTHYLNGISGLDKLIHHTGMGYEGGRQMVDFGKDKLTLRLAEDVSINTGYLANLYRNLVYSKLNGRVVIPENLLRFDMSIIISEVRNFNRVSNTLAKAARDSNETISMMNDNVSRYVFNLYECQMDFNKLSFTDDIDQAGLGTSMSDFSKGLQFDIYYKYVGMEMEKFIFNPSLEQDQAKYLNDTKRNPNSYQSVTDPSSSINQETEANVLDRFPNRPIDQRYRMNTFGNSPTEDRSFEFDFPMQNSKYVKSNIDVRNSNLEIAANQGSFRSGLNNIIDLTNQRLQNKFQVARSRLISGLAVRVRQLTGLRNISAPTNVYEGTNVGQFLLNRIQDFSNLAVGELLGKGTDYLTRLSTGAENTIFNRINGGVERLKGFDNIPNPNTLDGDNEVPNVYK